MNRRVLLAAAAIAFALSASPATAWAPLTSSRPVWTTAVPYELNQAGSADLGAETSEMVVRQGMDDWTRVSCTNLTNNYRGLTTRTVRNGDGVSTIQWLESGWPHDSNAIGVTMPRYFRTITEADMQLNGVHYTWTTGFGTGNVVSAYSIVLHEGGHYYGLGHSQDARSTMYFAYGGGVLTLNNDDQTGICTLYPLGGTQDCTTTGCPSGQTCTNGMCVTNPSGCTSDAQCTSTQRCDRNTGNCVPRTMTGGGLGASCSGADDCTSGLCLAGRCTQGCDWLSPTSCPGGYYCSGEATGSCNEGGVCVQGSAGGRANGEACGTATDCQSLYCSGGVCSQPCAPGGSGCPSGFACQVGSVAGCGSCQRSGTLGDPCEVGGDCTSNTCIEVDGDAFCSEMCDETSCPAGFSCRIDNGVGFCIPDSGGLGDACENNEDCLGGICAIEGDETYCTRLCDGTVPCPGEFECVATDDPSVGVCRAPSGGGCGCSAPGRGRGARGGLLAIGVLAMFALWRGRRRSV